MPTIFTRMKRTFDTPAPKELLTNPQSSGGSYRLTSAEDMIRYHRRLKRGSPWPDRIHRILGVSLFFAFLALLSALYLCLHCESSGDSKAAQEWFVCGLAASGLAAGLILGKVFWNGRYPR